VLQAVISVDSHDKKAVNTLVGDEATEIVGGEFEAFAGVGADMDPVGLAGVVFKEFRL
jgi:hypothetical protein